MAEFEIVSGKVTRLGSSQTVSGQVYGRQGFIQTKQTTTFSIGDKAAQINGSGAEHLAEGDQIIAVGKHKSGGVFHLAGYKNETNNVVQQANPMIFFILGAFFAIVGPMSFAIVAFIFFPLGLWLIWTGMQISKANKLLAASI